MFYSYLFCEKEAAQINGTDELGGQPSQDPKSSKRCFPDNGLRRFSRPAQGVRANTQPRLTGSDDNVFDYEYFLVVLLEKVDRDAFCMTGLEGEIARDVRDPTTAKQAVSAPVADE